MRPVRHFRAGVTALAGGLLLLSGANPVLSAGEGPSALYVASYKQIGDVVEVTLLNPNLKALAGKLVIEVIIDGETTLAVVPFTSRGGQKVFVTWVSSTPVEAITGVKIIVDDGAPI
jgi:hypothetical protein